MKKLHKIFLILFVMVFSVGLVGCDEDTFTYVNQDGKPLVVGKYDYSAFTGDYDYTNFKNYDWKVEDNKKLQTINYAGVKFEYVSFHKDFAFPYSRYEYHNADKNEASKLYEQIVSQLKSDYKYVVENEDSYYYVYFDDGVVISVALHELSDYAIWIAIMGDKNFEKIKQQ